MATGSDFGKRTLNRFVAAATPRNAGTVAEQGLSVIFLLVRTGTIAQISLGAWQGIRVAQPPLAYGSITLLVLATAMAMIFSCARTLCIPARPWGWIDLGLAPTAILVCALTLPNEYLLGDWEAWAPANAMAAVSTAGAWLRSVKLTALVSLTIGAIYCTTILAVGVDSPGSIAANTLSYPLFGVTAAVFAGYWRRLARESDALRDQAVRMAQRVEVDRAQMLVHDATGILRRLGDDGTPGEQIPALRRQASEESKRLRNYLTNAAALEGDDEVTDGVALHDLINWAIPGFDDLPLEVSTDLARDVTLQEQDALTLQRAVSTLLHNVRNHAAASQVVVHADSAGGRWEVVVADDGTGFNPDITSRGFGLREQVFAALCLRGMSVDLESTCGQGTVVTITGPLSGSAALKRV